MADSEKNESGHETNHALLTSLDWLQVDNNTHDIPTKNGW